ncbi:hypothetical protein ABBQ38_010582 [Trebouxia sp. C0009 RCD-2024]
MRSLQITFTFSLQTIRCHDKQHTLPSDDSMVCQQGAYMPQLVTTHWFREVCHKLNLQHCLLGSAWSSTHTGVSAQGHALDPPMAKGDIQSSYTLQVTNKGYSREHGAQTI